MMRVYICPDCGWMRMVSRRKNVECYKCGVQDMTLAKVDFATYVSWSEKERQEKRADLSDTLRTGSAAEDSM